MTQSIFEYVIFITITLRLCDFARFLLYWLEIVNMTENEISRIVVNVCYKIHTKLGPGLLESVYEAILYYELTNRGLKVERQKPLPVIWDEVFLDIGFRTDLIIEEKVIIEIKSVEQIVNVHPKQLLTYLKITGVKLGLLINFNESLIKNGITRIVNNL
jgi:GxxExxY protein